MPSQRVSIPNSRNIRLAGVLELPESPPHSFGMFSHCFTCSKDLKAIVRISRRLTQAGFAILRFDFTGLGDSDGDFSGTNFATNVADVLAAAEWLQEHYVAPKLLMGLSLGGAAMMVAVPQVAAARGLVTLAAPSCTVHLADFLVRQNPEIERQGVGSVTIGGRSHPIKKQLIDNLRQRDLAHDIRAIAIPHLILHSPVDETLGFAHAERIFELTGGSKSFVTLDNADHLLLNQPSDTEFVADQIEVWSRRWR